MVGGTAVECFLAVVVELWHAQPKRRGLKSREQETALRAASDLGSESEDGPSELLGDLVEDSPRLGDPAEAVPATTTKRWQSMTAPVSKEDPEDSAIKLLGLESS